MERPTDDPPFEPPRPAAPPVAAVEARGSGPAASDVSAEGGEGRARPRRASLLRRVALAVGALLALPYVLTVVYTVVDPPLTTVELARLLGGGSVTRVDRPIEAMSPHLVRAVVASEDARYCEHGGIDFRAIDDAVARAERRGRPVVGVSTIPMQLAKNLFLWPGRSYVRKALEAPLALWLDLVLSKQRLLEIYLNIAEWGPEGEFGAEAGARRAFGKGAEALSPREAALMATTLPNPILRRPGRPGGGHQRLAARIEARVKAMAGSFGCLDLDRGRATAAR